MLFLAAVHILGSSRSLSVSFSGIILASECFNSSHDGHDLTIVALLSLRYLFICEANSHETIAYRVTQLKYQVRSMCSEEAHKAFRWLILSTKYVEFIGRIRDYQDIE